MIIKAVIVDDEPYSRKIINTFLEYDTEVRIISECSNGLEAVDVIAEEKPDLVFLDVQMPGMDGFQVLEALKDIYIPNVIFTTAYNEYALRAFEVNALDYLVKPFDSERFRNSLKSAKENIFTKNYLRDKIESLLDSIEDSNKYLDRISIKDKGKFIFIKTEDINWIEAATYYIKIYLEDTWYLTRNSISVTEKNLDPSKFIRIHRSYIVNIDYIKELQQKANKYTVVLKNEKKLNLGKNYKKNLLSKYRIES